MPPRSSTHNDEQQPLLNGASNGALDHGARSTRADFQKPSRWQRTRDWLQQDVDTTNADLVLIVCFFLAGLIDSGAYNAYTCFTHMMTGNTIFAALGISNLPVTSSQYAWTKSVTSIVAFFIGALSFATFYRFFGQRKRWTLFASFLIHASLVTGAAVMVTYELSSESPAKDKSPSAAGLPKDPGFPWLDLVPIAFLSFQGAGKLLSSRQLEQNFLPTVVLSTLYCDLLSDPALFTAGLLQNGKRNRRAGGAIFYFVGAVSGGAMAKGKAGFTGGLWLAAGINFAISFAWLLWKSEKAEEESEDTQA